LNRWRRQEGKEGIPSIVAATRAVRADGSWQAQGIDAGVSVTAVFGQWNRTIVSVRYGAGMSGCTYSAAFELESAWFININTLNYIYKYNLMCWSSLYLYNVLVLVVLSVLHGMLIQSDSAAWRGWQVSFLPYLPTLAFRTPFIHFIVFLQTLTIIHNSYRCRNFIPRRPQFRFWLTRRRRGVPRFSIKSNFYIPCFSARTLLFINRSSALSRLTFSVIYMQT